MEPFQRSGSFKFRGAYSRISLLDEDERRRGVVAYSSGNHAQAVALASSLVGTGAVIVMPEDAPAEKVAATRGYGAEVVSYDRYREDRAEIGAALARDRGLTLVPPYDDLDVMAGQGTAALELAEDARPSERPIRTPASSASNRRPATTPADPSPRENGSGSTRCRPPSPTACRWTRRAR